MGGPVAVVYLAEELTPSDVEAVSRLMADRSWRKSPVDTDVMTCHIEPISFEHDPEQIIDLEQVLGWRPVQQVQLVCHGKALVEFHIDLATAAAQLARQFDGSVMVSAENRYSEEIDETSFELAQSSIADASERLVGPEWLDQFAALEEPGFCK